MSVFVNDLGIVNALGDCPASVWRALIASERSLTPCDWVPNKPTYTAKVSANLLPVPERLHLFNSRNAQLALTAAAQINARVSTLRERFGAHRIAVVVGTSTSGIAEGERAVRAQHDGAKMPDDYHYRQQEIGNLSHLVAAYCGVSGPAYTLSTACSSSAHALGSGYRLLAAGMADAVIVGGADSLCRLTVNGFAALDSVDEKPCNPFGQDRAGINIGEAAAFFVLTREPLGEAIELMAVGASSDAHHISAPEPNGRGAEQAITAALQQAQLSANEVDYINLHGTGTALNDAMESAVIERVFCHRPPCSSAKGQLGHTLGAAGATEAALCWLALSSHNTGGYLPPHVYTGPRDETLPAINLNVNKQRWQKTSGRICVSNSFAFGGNNAAVILGDKRP